jgi:hypothetical protein
MWKLKADERLAHWREFRKKLDTLELENAVQEVADFWTRCPFTPYYLDIDQPLDWPDPWTLIEENFYCDIAIALGMLYTIKFTAHSPAIELRVYQDPETRVYYNLAWIDDGKYVLNMTEGEVVNKAQIAKHLSLRYCYGDAELKLNSY